MARIGILTCSNCTDETNCAAVVCLADMRKRNGLFERYGKEESLDLIGMISCAGCPTIAAPEKILKKVKALADFKIDALHFSFCMTALCPFLSRYAEAIRKAHPGLTLVEGTHKPVDKSHFQKSVKELLCPTVIRPQTMNDVVRGTLKMPA